MLRPRATVKDGDGAGRAVASIQAADFMAESDDPTVVVRGPLRPLVCVLTRAAAEKWPRPVRHALLPEDAPFKVDLARWGDVYSESGAASADIPVAAVEGCVGSADVGEAKIDEAAAEGPRSDTGGPRDGEPDGDVAAETGERE
jgi:hypothetical protein